jgi:hypothetical protein
VWRNLLLMALLLQVMVGHQLCIERVAVKLSYQPLLLLVVCCVPVLPTEPQTP